MSRKGGPGKVGNNQRSQEGHKYKNVCVRVCARAQFHVVLAQSAR